LTLHLYDLVRPARRAVKRGQGQGRLITLEHVVADQLRLSGWGHAPDLRTTGRFFEAGDLLFSALRPSQRKVILAPFAGICSAEFLVLRPVDPARTGLAFAAVSSPTIIARAARRATGTRMPRVKWLDIADLPVTDASDETACLIDRLALAFEDRLSILHATQLRRAALLVALSRGASPGCGPRFGDVAALRTSLTRADRLPASPCLYGVADLPGHGLSIPTRASHGGRSRKRAVRAGDVLVSTLRPELQKAGLCPEDGFVSTEIAALDVRPAWRGAVLGAVRDPGCWASWQAAASGTSLPRFNPRDLLDARLSLIRAELDERADALRAATEGLMTDDRLGVRLRAMRDRVLPALLDGDPCAKPNAVQMASAALSAGYTARPRRV